MPNVLRFGGWATVVEAKTTAYTVKPRDNGKLFTNRGAGASVTFTLPKLAAGTGNLKGVRYEFFTAAAQPIVIASDPSDSLVTDTDAASDSITTATQTGQHITVISDGTGWLCIVDPSAATTATAVRAVTIAT